MGRISWQHDHRTGRICFELVGIEFIPQTNVEDSRNYGVDAILRMAMRHQLHAARHFDPDHVWSRFRRLTHDDGQPDGRWKRRERFPIDIFRQGDFENLLPELVRPDFALLSRLYGAGFLRHTNLHRAENVELRHRHSKHDHQDWLRSPPIQNVRS